MASLGIKKVTLILLMVLCAFMPMGAQQRFDHLREGDLLFHVNSEGNAITSVTAGVDALPIDHVGVVHRIGGEKGLLYVIEAVKPAVRLTSINAFLEENPQLLVGRVQEGILDVPGSIRRCLAMVGKPYDDLYLPGDSAIYCSELVQLNYVNTHGEAVFEAVPMSFHDDTGQVTEYWRAFYADHGMMVPEGAPGSNPGELSRRWQVSIIDIFNLGFKDDENHDVERSNGASKLKK